MKKTDRRNISEIKEDLKLCIIDRVIAYCKFPHNNTVNDFIIIESLKEVITEIESIGIKTLKK